jgi:predicted nucleic acid-binding protein
LRLYAESSAVLSWLLEEAPGGAAGEALSRADRVLTSDLTLIECHRVLVRGVSAGLILDESAEVKREALEKVASHWVVLRIAGEIAARARLAFPVEPVRALDAIHLASALSAAARLPGLSMLSLDGRVRENAAALGLPLLP